MTMFVERVAAIHRGTKTTEVKAEIFNAVVKYFLLMALLDMGVGGRESRFSYFLPLHLFLHFCCIMCGVSPQVRSGGARHRAGRLERPLVFGRSLLDGWNHSSKQGPRFSAGCCA